MSLPTPTFIGQQATVAGKTYQVVALNPPMWKAITTGNKEVRLRFAEKSAAHMTLAEAQADGNLLVGQYVRLTDYGKALYRTVAASDTGGFYQTGLQGGLKLRLEKHDRYLADYFGAKPDKVTDSSSSITAADLYCASIGSPLFFADGEYRGFGLRPTTSWFGISGDPKKCMIKANSYDLGDNAGFVRYQSQSGFAVGGITFDGDVSADPVAWNNSNYDSFTGSQALHLNNCADWVVINVICQNSYTSNFRTEGCNGGLVQNLKTIRARGNFGDGYYSVSSDNINIVDSTARNYTRIGFVCEGYTGGIPSSEVFYSGCVALDGHDQSIDYGGGEYNAGFWFENSTSIYYANCYAANQASYGFVAAGTRSKSGESTVEGFYSNCKTSACVNVGFSASSLTHQLFVGYVNCHSIGSSICYSLTGLGGDQAVYNSCKGISTGTLAGSNLNSAIFFVDSESSTPVRAIINDCEGLFLDNSGVADNNANTADITTFTANPEHVVVTNYRRIDNTTPRIKNRQSPNSSLILNNTDADLWIFPAGGGNLVEINGGKVKGEIRAKEIKLNTEMSGDLNFYDGKVSGSLNMSEYRSQHSIQAGLYTGRPIVFDVDLKVTRDISANGYALRLQYEDATGETAIVKGTLQNTAGTTTSNNFIWKVRTPSQLFANGLITDNTVTSTYLDNATPMNFATGEQKVSLV